MLRDDLSTLIKFSIFLRCVCLRGQQSQKRNHVCRYARSCRTSINQTDFDCCGCCVLFNFKYLSSIHHSGQWNYSRSVEWVSNSMPKLIFYQLHTHPTDPDNDSLDPTNASPGHPTASWFCCTIRICLEEKKEEKSTRLCCAKTCTNLSSISPSGTSSKRYWKWRIFEIASIKSIEYPSHCWFPS